MCGSCLLRWTDHAWLRSLKVDWACPRGESLLRWTEPVVLVDVSERMLKAVTMVTTWLWLSVDFALCLVASHSWTFIWWLCNKYFSTVGVCCCIWDVFIGKVPSRGQCRCSKVILIFAQLSSTCTVTIRLLFILTWWCCWRLPKAFSVCSAHMWTEDAGLIYPKKTRSTRVDTFLSPFHYLHCSSSVMMMPHGSACCHTCTFLSDYCEDSKGNTQQIFVFHSEYFYRSDYIALIYYFCNGQYRWALLLSLIWTNIL